MNIRQIINAFAAAEEGLSVEEPYPVTIRRVYKYLPPGKDALETPCVMHQYRPISEARGPNGLRVRDWSVVVRILVAKRGADSDVQSEIAAAFDDALVSALDGRVKLQEGDTYQRMFEGGPQDDQPSIFEWNGVSYVAVEFEYNVTTHEVVVYGA